jgi:hypothetical protein
VIRKLFAAVLTLTASSAFAASLPGPSFNDFPELYSQAAVASQAQASLPRTAPAGRFMGGSHPDPMHDSY